MEAILWVLFWPIRVVLCWAFEHDWKINGQYEVGSKVSWKCRRCGRIE